MREYQRLVGKTIKKTESEGNDFSFDTDENKHG